MGDKLTKLTVGTVSRNVQHLTAGEGIDISALGVISVDSNDLYTKTEIDTMLDDYYTKTEVDTTLDDYYTETEADALLDDKVDKETGKGLSTNDYTTADKTIVSNVTTNLNNKVDKVTGKGLSTNDYTNADKAIVDAVTTNLDGKVDKVSGKGLSTNDYTTAEKNKLAGIADGAEVNVQSDWNQTNTSADDFIKNKPTIPDVSNVYTKTQTDNLLANKVDKVTGKGLSANDYTNADKAIVDAVTTNLAGKVDKVTGKGLSTNDYTTAEKTKLAGIADGAEVNVQSDWNVTDSSSDAFIKNKPTIPDVSNFYTKTQVDTALGNKVDKVTGKGLSTNDYTNADKAIVGNVTANLANKVDKVTGKGLSTNDYTDADKAIVDGVTTALAGKQNTLTAGSNITISGNTISATDTTYTAGANVQISASNVISATDTKYTAGDKIAISSANVISLNLTKADILSMLGYKETTLTMTATDGTTTTETILVKE